MTKNQLFENQKAFFLNTRMECAKFGCLQKFCERHSTNYCGPLRQKLKGLPVLKANPLQSYTRQSLIGISNAMTATNGRQVKLKRSYDRTK